MTDRPAKRRPVTGGSRAPVSRPRKVAGAGSSGLPPTSPPASDSRGRVEDRLEDRLEEEVARHPASEDWPDEVHPAEEDGPSTPPRGAGPRTRRVLVAVVVLLAGVVAAEAWYLWLRPDPLVSSSRPVVTGPVETASAVDTAARAIQDIVSTSYENYDEQVEQATTLMTEPFAEEFTATAEDVKDSILEEKTEVSVEIVAQSVMSASPEQVQALIFLNQSVTKDGEGLTVTPYRAKVTVVRTDRGWLVSKIDTQ